MDGRIEATLCVRARHVCRNLDWLLWVAGTSVGDSKRLMGAGYLAYILAFGILWALFSWAALEHFLAGLLAQVPVSLVRAPLAVVLVAWCTVALVCALRALWRSPFRLSAADVSWLSGSRPALATMVFSDVTLRCVGTCLVGVLAGLLATSGMGALMRREAALSSALAGLCAALLPCVVAEARLARGRRDVSVVVAPASAVVAVCVMGIAVAPPWGFARATVPLLLLACLLIVTLALLGRRVCMPALACEAVLGTESDASRWLRLTNRDRYRELTRDARLARRRWLPTLPLGHRGWRTLASRAALVHLRRFEGLGDILLYAGVSVPLLCALCLGTLDGQLMVPCAAAVTLNYRAARELVRVFCADEDNRLVRPLLPFGSLQLLVADSLTALSLAILMSCLVCAVTLGSQGLQACVIAALLDVATVVCGGLSRVMLPVVYRRVSFELAFLAIVVVACLVSLTGAWTFVAAVLAALVLAGGVAIALGRDTGA